MGFCRGFRWLGARRGFADQRAREGERLRSQSTLIHVADDARPRNRIARESRGFPFPRACLLPASSSRRLGSRRKAHAPREEATTTRRHPSEERPHRQQQREPNSTMVKASERRTRAGECTTSRYRGVTKHRRSGRWESHIVSSNARIHGAHRTPPLTPSAFLRPPPALHPARPTSGLQRRASRFTSVDTSSRSTRLRRTTSPASR